MTVPLNSNATHILANQTPSLRRPGKHNRVRKSQCILVHSISQGFLVPLQNEIEALLGVDSSATRYTNGLMPLFNQPQQDIASPCWRSLEIIQTFSLQRIPKFAGRVRDFDGGTPCPLNIPQ